MEVAVPSPSRDYHFHGGRSRVSTVPTTKVFGNYFYSAPSSPMRMPEFDRGFNELQSSQKDEPELEDEDFAFDICQQLEATTLSADELFDDALSSSASRRAVRSLSPNRVSSSPWDEKQQRLTPGSPATGSNSNTTSSKGSRRWRLKDLFRSASEGRGTGKDPLRKYSTVYKKQEEVKHTSSKFNHSRNGPVSVSEPHFSLNKAASEDKKKTFLPYKGILGGLLFNPAAHMHTNFRSSR
ncbi:pheromone receptor-like protein [Cucumis melo var. makuwa]|uniref:Pheromone receptor-like protein n=1 Tax=Cucumis melo var. makuwa TaxID=1194695 RepID=A0A5D3D9J0_CUCMM|nr:pheromone receptor-like protein [Cucumis melo var. makuwa]